MVRKPLEKTKEVWGCSHPSVVGGIMCCDGDCSLCSYRTVQIVKL